MAKRSRSTSRPAPQPAAPGSPGGTRGRVAAALSGLGRLLLWALVLAVPLALAPTAVDSFRLPKRMLAEWLGLASLLAFALSAALARLRDPRMSMSLRRGRSALLAVAPLTLVATLGLLVSHHPEHVRSALPDLWIGVACLVGWSLALGSERLGRLLSGLGVPGALLSGLAVLQFHDVYRPFAFARGEEAARLGVTSLAGNAGDLGAFLVFPVLIAQWRLAGARSGRSGRLGTVLWVAVLALCLYGLAVTQTLTVLAAAVAGSALFWLVRLPRRRALAAVGAALGIAVVLAVTVAPLRNRLVTGFEAFQEGKVNQALSGRLDGWRAAWWMIEEHPAVGVGHGAYRAEFAPAKLSLIDRGVSFYRGHVDPFFANAHNEILEAGAEWGILGWLALAWGLWVLLRAVARGFGPGSDAGVRTDRGMAVGTLAALGVLSLGQFPFRIALTAYPALLVMAWIFRRADERAPEPAGEPAEATTGKRGTAWLAVAVAVALLVALVWQTGRWRDLLGASKRLRVVEAVTAQVVAAGGEVPSRVITGSVRLLREAERLDPSDVAVEAALAGQYLLADTPLRAEEAYRRALALEPRPVIYLNLGRALLMTGDRDGALDAFEKAVRLAPRLLRQVPATMRREVRRATESDPESADSADPASS